MKLNTVEQIKAALEQAQAEYEAKVFAIAEQVHAQKIVPLCEKHGYDFYAGNAMYVFKSKATGEYDESDTFPKVMRAGEKVKEIMDMFMIEYGFPADSLGTMMPNHVIDELDDKAIISTYTIKTKDPVIGDVTFNLHKDKTISSDSLQLFDNGWYNGPQPLVATIDSFKSIVKDWHKQRMINDKKYSIETI